MPTVGDALYEGNETFTATLTSPVGAVLGTAVGVGTIVDDEVQVLTADLSMVKTLLTASPAPAGSTVTYRVVASNAGPAAAIGATVADTVPAELSDVTWTCTATAGSSCGSASGTGHAVSVSANIAAGGSVTLTISGTAPASGTIGANTAVATVPPGTSDPNPGNNTDTVPEVPVTPEPAELRLVKQAARREVRVGDLVRYTVTIDNIGPVDAVGASLVDTPPPGFTYVDGSLQVDDADDSAVLAGTNPIRIEGIDVAAGGRATVVYYLRVGAGVGPGVFANHVIAHDGQGEPISNNASAEVEVAGDPLLDESLILGSVFDDRNGNGLQDMGERGVPGVRIASVEGLVMETDAHGRYHLLGIEVGNKARGRNFILKVDPATLPPGTVFTTANPLVRRITAGLPVRFDFGVKLPDGRMGGGQSRVDIDLAELLFAPGSAEIKAEHAAVFDRIAATVREHGGGRLTVTASGDGEALAFRRAQAVQAALLERLDAGVRERTTVDVVSQVEPEQSLLALGNTVALGELLFDTDRAAIRPQYRALIRELADAVERQQCGTLEVHGHADRRGSDDYNMKLAMRRAKAVADAIAALLSPEARARLRVEAVDPAQAAGTGHR